jgi:hypothetical protein
MFQAGDFVEVVNGNIYQAFLFNREWIGVHIDAEYWVELDYNPKYKQYRPVKIFRPIYIRSFNIELFSEYKVHEYDIYELAYPEKEGMIFETDNGYYYFINNSYIPLNTIIEYNGNPIRRFGGFATVVGFLNSKDKANYLVEKKWVKV